MPERRWQLIVPVKPAGSGKSRLGAGERMTRAIAVDTITAAARARGVESVVVVTADGRLAAELGRPETSDRSSADADAPATARIRIVTEDAPRGIAAAISTGLAALAALGTDRPRAVLLGDLPALRPDDLDAALAAAELHPLAFVADADGTGTTLVTALAGRELVAHFGTGSAGMHRAAGLTELDVPTGSSIRRDVDTPDQLALAAAHGLGPATSAELSALTRG